MGLYKEAWAKHLRGPFFSTRTFLRHAIDFSEYIYYNKVHVPNGSVTTTIYKNLKNLPAQVEQVTDEDLEFNLNNFKMAPVTIEFNDAAQLSYNKRESVIGRNKELLYQTAAMDIAASWVAGVDKPYKKEGTVKSWVKAVAKQFAKELVPAVDRYIMLSADSYYDLLDSFTDQEQFAFSQTANAAEGILGKYYGFTIVDEHLLPEGTEMLAWQKQCVGTAFGKVLMHGEADSASYYGGIFSGEMNAGGVGIRTDKKGLFCVNKSGEKAKFPEEVKTFKNAKGKTGKEEKTSTETDTTQGDGSTPSPGAGGL